MKPTASFLAERGLIDKIIREPKGGAQSNPLATALAIREDMIWVELEFGHLTPDQILARRIQRVETSQPILIGHLSGKPSQDHRSLLERLLRR
ncbi:hypothetical protein HYS96_03510 [Candidatus Daviesbacteria bacterium]|nr:hypothetical protein [Candidatus Daviesbacteria bacterium]